MNFFHVYVGDLYFFTCASFIHMSSPFFLSEKNNILSIHKPSYYIKNINS